MGKQANKAEKIVGRENGLKKHGKFGKRTTVQVEGRGGGGDEFVRWTHSCLMKMLFNIAQGPNTNYKNVATDPFLIFGFGNSFYFIAIYI
jgi:hypothetical protein